MTGDTRRDTSDEPALMRLRAASTATRIAESFREQGAHALLMMDSLTRVVTAEADASGAPRRPTITTVESLPPTVNDPDAKKRERRLNLLMRFRDAVNRVADFSRIEG